MHQTRSVLIVLLDVAEYVMLHSHFRSAELTKGTVQRALRHTLFTLDGT